MHPSAHKRYWVPHSRKDTRITFFAIQGDETKTADLDQLAQLLVFVRFVGPSSIEEEMLFCRPLEITTEADVLQVVATCFNNSGTKWEKLVGICTDSALAMLRSRSGLFARINQEVPIPLNLTVRSTVRLGFQLQMAYLLDIFHRLNNWNLLLQGKNTNRINSYGNVQAFVAKLRLWHRQDRKRKCSFISQSRYCPWRRTDCTGGRAQEQSGSPPSTFEIGIRTLFPKHRTSRMEGSS